MVLYDNDKKNKEVNSCECVYFQMKKSMTLTPLPT